MAILFGPVAYVNVVALDDWSDRVTTGEGRIYEIQIGRGAQNQDVSVGGELTITVCARFDQPLVDPTFGVIIHDMNGAPLLDLRSIHDGLHLGRIAGDVAVRLTVPKLGLYPGCYLLSPWIMDTACSRDIDFPRLCATLDVFPAAGEFGDLKLDPAWGRWFVRSHWERTAHAC